jgi:hypothetical protein
MDPASRDLVKAGLLALVLVVMMLLLVGSSLPS